MNDKTNDAKPSNLPGLTLSRDLFEVWSQMISSNVETYNDLWSEVRQGEVTLKSLLQRTAGSLERYWRDLGHLVRAPFVDTDRPNWAMFWWDKSLKNKTKINRLPLQRLALGRHYPKDTELHRTDLQMLGRDSRIESRHYKAALEDGGRSLVVTLEDVPADCAVGDYVGLITAKALIAPLGVVMVTVSDGKDENADADKAAPAGKRRGGRRKKAGET